MRTCGWLAGVTLGLWCVAAALPAADAAPPAEQKPPAAKPNKKNPKATNEPGPNDVLLELEDFKLTDIEVVDAPDASKGKAVRFTKTTSQAEGEAKLAKGSYRVEVYMKVHDTDHDTMYLNILDKKEIKVFPSHAKLPGTEFVKVPVAEGPALPLLIKMDADGPVKLTFLAKETDMLVDRVLFRRQPDEAK